MVDHDGMSRRPGRRGDADLAAEVRVVREEYAEEEAAEVEAAANAAALEVALSLRTDRDLDGALRRRAAQDQISPPRWSVVCSVRGWVVGTSPS